MKNVKWDNRAPYSFKTEASCTNDLKMFSPSPTRRGVVLKHVYVKYSKQLHI